MGARVITTVSTDEEVNYLQDLPMPFTRLIDTRREQVSSVIMQETGGMGVDIVIDTPLHSYFACMDDYLAIMSMCIHC